MTGYYYHNSVITTGYQNYLLITVLTLPADCTTGVQCYWSRGFVCIKKPRGDNELKLRSDRLS